MINHPSILFVCLGNICRSPLAEAALRMAAESDGLKLEVDSAGTGGWHIGKPPDSRAIAIADAMGVDISGFRARQVEAADFNRFTHIFALDAQNLVDLIRIAPLNASAQLSLLLDMVPGREGQAVADPYYGETDGFETTWREVNEAAAALVKHFRI
ncbi:low molecular weight phosphotyrosine protein phosphatase [Aurantiacibacter atlanticus]|uniref:protein-tyrosine-phosphatase n=1 Tax=Aurantiacibacter atlanticus TaxID=1648404 RepID=A0A0H4VKQ6_9SPHN|nr:low molecular weight phosphotyrosine protein phosphatase [Aurantiacibacter atlanticus]